jgi:MOSC domain-containing protein
VDAEGNVINGKRTPLVHRVRTSFDLDRGLVELRAGVDRGVYHLERDRTALEAALAGCLEQSVRLIENADTGFPDDMESPGPTVIGAATLRTVAGWFAGLDEDEARRRFRANLEIDGADEEPLPPFWEDRLYGPAGQEVRFRVGDVEFAGTNPCQRCIVPTRDAATGAAWPSFAKAFARQRKATLPAWAERSRFDHFYRLAVNTRLAGAGGIICVGDAVEVS